MSEVRSDEKALACALLKIAEAHARGSSLHAKRIQQFTRLLVDGAAERGYAELQCETFSNYIVKASLLHDIGKIVIPCDVVAKQGALTEEEFHIVQRHTIAGEQLLHAAWVKIHTVNTPSLFIQTAAHIARSHHERWDGAGYPDRLVGDAIHIGARIVAIADVYEALRATRTYKKPWTHEATVQYIQSEAGRHFDPDLVDIFLSLSPLFDVIWTNVGIQQNLSV